MKGILYYYSGTGNTKLACEYIAKKIKAIEIELCDITKDNIADPAEFEFIGFATYTDFGGPSNIFRMFIDSLPQVKGKNAFIFNTYGMMSMGTQKILYKKLTKKGFAVINGHALHAPENYPPLIMLGKGFVDSPNQYEQEKFNIFIAELDYQISEFKEGNSIEPSDIDFGGFMNIFSSLPRFIRHIMMGDKYVDDKLCTECRMCERVCQYNAIKCRPKPIFDETICQVCWACYNHCPTRAIYTEKTMKHGNKGQYPQPKQQYRDKLVL